MRQAQPGPPQPEGTRPVVSLARNDFVRCGVLPLGNDLRSGGWEKRAHPAVLRQVWALMRAPSLSQNGILSKSVVLARRRRCVLCGGSGPLSSRSELAFGAESGVHLSARGVSATHRSQQGQGRHVRCVVGNPSVLDGARSVLRPSVLRPSFRTARAPALAPFCTPRAAASSVETTERGKLLFVRGAHVGAASLAAPSRRPAQRWAFRSAGYLVWWSPTE